MKQNIQIKIIEENRFVIPIQINFFQWRIQSIFSFFSVKNTKHFSLLFSNMNIFSYRNFTLYNKQEYSDLYASFDPN